jgi:hypothetical protein
LKAKLDQLRKAEAARNRENARMDFSLPAPKLRLATVEHRLMMARKSEFKPNGDIMGLMQTSPLFSKDLGHMKST